MISLEILYSCIEAGNGPLARRVSTGVPKNGGGGSLTSHDKSGPYLSREI